MRLKSRYQKSLRFSNIYTSDFRLPERCALIRHRCIVGCIVHHKSFLDGMGMKPRVDYGRCKSPPGTSRQVVAY